MQQQRSETCGGRTWRGGTTPPRCCTAARERPPRLAVQAPPRLVGPGCLLPQARLPPAPQPMDWIQCLTSATS
jgi:hypothetical protein